MKNRCLNRLEINSQKPFILHITYVQTNVCDAMMNTNRIEFGKLINGIYPVSMSWGNACLYFYVNNEVYTYSRNSKESPNNTNIVFDGHDIRIESRIDGNIYKYIYPLFNKVKENEKINSKRILCNDYNNKEKEEKYDLITKSIEKRFPYINEDMIFRDVYAYGIDELSTAGVALKLGFKNIYAWGNNISKLTQNKYITTYNCDIDRLLFNGKPSLLSFGNFISDVTLFDPYAIDHINKDVLMRLLYCSKLTVAFISNGTYRCSGSNHKNHKTLWEHQYPNGDGKTKKEWIEILAEKCKEKRMKFEIEGKLSYGTIVSIFNPSIL